MYDVLDLYEEPYNPRKPVVGFDEKPKQLLKDSRRPMPMTPGSPERYDYEYIRQGKANIFVAVEPKAGKRTIKVTDRRGKKDFAQFIKHLADNTYPNAHKIRIVLDNLNTHTKKHYTKHSENRRRNASCEKSNSTTPQNTQAGST